MVTGATGLLGSHLLCHLARCGETIIALKRYKSHVEEAMALFRVILIHREMLYPG